MKVAIDVVADGGQYIIRKSNDDGKSISADVLTSEDRPTDAAIGGILGSYSKQHGDLRRAMLAVCASVAENPRLDGFLGKGDCKAGKYPDNLKKAWGDCEVEYLRKLAEDKHAKLKKDFSEDDIQTFIANVKNDKNYTGVKTLCIKFFAFCGMRPANASGKLTPVPVMQTFVSEKLALHKEKKDSSYRAQIMGILEVLNADTSPDHNELAAAVGAANELYITLKGIVDGLNASLTERPSVGDVHTRTRDVSSVAKDTIGKAKTAAAEPALM